MKRLLTLICLIMLLCTPALAELSPAVLMPGPSLTDNCLSVGASEVSWPTVTGMQDEAQQDRINDLLLQAADTQRLIARLAQVMSAPTPLHADWEGILSHDILSVKVRASGAVYDTRPTEVLTCFSYDLLQERLITLADLFANEEEALSYIEDYLCEQVIPNLSGYLDAAQLLPLPDQWWFDREGITFCYPISRYQTLSQRCGTVKLLWYELMPLLRTDEDSVPYRMELISRMASGDGTISALKDAAWMNRLPGIPAKLGENMKQLTDSWGLLMDPELCEGGRLFSLQDDRFRSTMLLTDSLDRGWDNSTVSGIRSDRICLGGLITGKTTQAEWRQLLGEPEQTLMLSGDQAEAWRLCEGTSDYYTIGQVRFRLHCSTDGILQTLFMMQ